MGFILTENPLTQEGELVQWKRHETRRWISMVENTKQEGEWPALFLDFAQWSTWFRCATITCWIWIRDFVQAHRIVQLYSIVKNHGMQQLGHDQWIFIVPIVWLGSFTIDMVKSWSSLENSPNVLAQVHLIPTIKVVGTHHWKKIQKKREPIWQKNKRSQILVELNPNGMSPPFGIGSRGSNDHVYGG